MLPPIAITRPRPLIRGACPDDRAAILSLVRLAWPTETEHHFYDDPQFTWSQFRLAQVDQQIVSVLKIYRRPIFWGEDTAVLGGIGDVVTHPRFRGRGYAGMLLDDAAAYMAENGYELSMLFSGLTAFYQRHGWEPVSQPLFTADLSGSVAESVNSRYVVRVFDASRDANAVAGIYAAHGRRCRGPLVRSPSYWLTRPPWSSEDCLAFGVAVHAGQVVGYLRACRECDTLRVEECLWRERHHTCVIDLLRRTVQYAQQQGFSRLAVCVPRPEVLIEAWEQMKTSYRSETFNAMMLREIDGPSLARKRADGDLPWHYWRLDAF